MNDVTTTDALEVLRNRLYALCTMHVAQCAHHLNKLELEAAAHPAIREKIQSLNFAVLESLERFQQSLWPEPGSENG